MKNKVIQNIVNEIRPRKREKLEEELPLNEELEHLQEMANYSKRDTSLPMNIWIERTEIKNRGGHNIRLEFQLNTDLHCQKYKTASVSLTDNKVIYREQYINSPKCKLTDSDFTQVENFAYNNNFALRQLHDEVITESEFITKLVIKGGKRACESRILSVIEKTKKLIRQNINNHYYDSNKSILEKAQKAVID